MTQNDQAAINEQLTQLRLQGLSIDGDNRYKQDLIDAIIGAMMFGAQGANPPPASHWLEQFYVIAREERDALARVEAERDTAIVQMQNIRKGRDAINKELGDTEFKLCIAYSQLAEAVGLVEKSADLAGELGDYLMSLAKRHSGTELLDHERNLRAFLARHAQAEQQEAQGAQAGDERAAFKKEYDAFRQWAGERLTARQLDLDEVGLFYDEIAGFAHDAWQARAALATQPAAEKLWAVHAQGPDDLFAAFSREDAEAHAAAFNALPCPPGISVSAVVIESPWPAAEHWKYLAEQWKYLADKEQESNSPPAAAHGDDGRTCRFCQKRFESAGECGNHVDQFHHDEAEPAAHGDEAVQYRLLRVGEIIQATDELLRDDCTTWQPMSDGPQIGIGWGWHSRMMPMRRVDADMRAQAGEGGEA